MWQLLLIVLAGGVPIGGRLWGRYNRFQRLQQVVRASGLQVEASSGAWDRRSGIKARAGPLNVWIEEPAGTLIVIEVPGPPGFLELRISSRPQPQPREIDTGDPLLDRQLHIAGPPRLVRALLDAETRQLLLRVADKGLLEIMGGQLRTDSDAMMAFDLLPLLLEIGRRFAQPLDAVQRLADNARKDPEAGVRLQNLLLLARELPEDPKTLEALRAGCSDASPLVRLRAAKELGAEGRGLVEEFAESTEEDALSAEAVSFLGPGLPFERTRAILDQALRSRLLQTALACLEALGRSGDAADIEALVKVLADEEGELAAAAARALGTTGSPAAEPALILALQREQADLRVEAANALGRIGSTAAVLPLREAAERTAHDPDLRKATRQAIAEIQSRLPGASPGQLSLAGADVGNLSLAQTDAGQLSLAVDPAGQLDLSSGEES
jgi:HEAT repeat protein